MIAMRFHLFRITVQRSHQHRTGFIVAPDENRAEDVAKEMVLKPDDESCEIDRVDQELPEDHRLGLDSLLEHATVGLASFCAGVGWIAHAIPLPKLKLFRVEIIDGDTHFVAAPNIDVATVVFNECVPLEEGEDQVFGVFEGLGKLDERMQQGLDDLLDLGSVGMVTWNEEDGWARR